MALERNNTLKAKDLAAILGVDYETHGGSLRNIRAQFILSLKNRLSLKSLKFHRARGWIFADLITGLQERRMRALDCGWSCAKGSKNGMIYFNKAGLGRLEWFGTGRVNFWVSKPATKARVVQLLACGFLWTGLLSSEGKNLEKFESWAAGARLKGAHLVVDLGEVVPYAKVEALKESNGVVVKLGDLSHRSSLEIEFCYPDWAERNERLHNSTMDYLKRLSDNLTKTLDLNAQQSKLLGDIMQEQLSKKIDPDSVKRLYE